MQATRENNVKNIMKLKLSKPTSKSGELKYTISSNTMAKLEDLAKGVIDEIRVKWNRHSTNGLKEIYMIWTRHENPRQRFACTVYDAKTETIPLVDFNFMPDSFTAAQKVKHNVLPMGEALSRIHPTDYPSDRSFLVAILDEWVCVPGCVPNMLSVQWRLTNVYKLYISCVPLFVFPSEDCAIGALAYDMAGECVIGVVGARNVTNGNYSLLCTRHCSNVVNLHSEHKNEIVFTIHDYSSVNDGISFKYLKKDEIKVLNVNDLRELEASEIIKISESPNRVVINQLNESVNINILSEILNVEAKEKNNEEASNQIDNYNYWLSLNFKEDRYKYFINTPYNRDIKIPILQVPVSVKKGKKNKRF